MDMTQAVEAVEQLVTSFTADKRTPREVRVRPSGDDATHIKVWVDLGGGVDEATCQAWAAACKAAAAKVAGGYTVEVRAESL